MYVRMYVCMYVHVCTCMTHDVFCLYCQGNEIIMKLQSDIKGLKSKVCLFCCDVIHSFEMCCFFLILVEVT